MPRGGVTSTSGKNSRKGIPNKTTSRVKDAIALLAEQNVDNMQTWLEEVAKENKLEALKFMLSLMEYNIPKLARTENTTKMSVSIEDALQELDV
jgi:hypothetical protein